MQEALGNAIEMPNIEGAEHLLAHLNNMGWCTSSGMGISPLSFIEIKAYIELTETPLNADEVMLIRQMSQGYVSEVQDKNPNKHAPYATSKPAELQASSIINMFSGIATIQE